MIEANGLRPAGLVVAVGARVAERILMDVDAPVTRGAARIGSCRFDGAAVAARAGELGMRTVEREARVDGMVERDFGPRQRCVAGFALGAVVACMDVIGTMAADASWIGRVAAARVDMARRADEAVMAAGRRKARFCEVIELRLQPTDGRVTVLAQFTVAACVDVVDSVASDTVGPRIDVGLIAMTTAAVGAVVIAGQAKVGRIVIERRIDPSRLGVAVATGVAEIAVVTIVLAVAADAGRIRIAESLVGRVTTHTGPTRMAAVQREVRKVVIERVSVETDDVGVPPLVLGVATRALGICNGSEAAVIPLTRIQVCIDLGMAVEAPRALIFARERLVARGARILVGRMIGADGPGHQDAL